MTKIILAALIVGSVLLLPSLHVVNDEPELNCMRTPGIALSQECEGIEHD